MLLLFTLLACGVDVDEPLDMLVIDDTPAEEGRLITTKVVEASSRPIDPPRYVVLPDGEAVLDESCMGVRLTGAPGPASRGDRVDTGARPPASLAKRPSPRPRGRPMPKKVERMPDPTPPGSRDSPNGMGPPTGSGGLADAEEPEPVRERSVARPEGPTMEWGATVHLSNDDSMSLASAQRLLWTLQNGRRPSAAQVRPHELLNYFSFDTAPVPDGQAFSVLGGAVQDGDSLSVAFAVKGAVPERLPLDLTVVIDRSGSMSAEGRMEYLKRGLHAMQRGLHRGDRVDIVLFDSRVCTPVRDWVAGRDDPEILTRAIDALQPRGATDLDGGLREAYHIQTSRTKAEVHGRNRRVLLITDAMLNLGNVNEDLVSEVGRHFEEHDIRLTGVGVGRDFNDAMLDKLTEKGKGAYVYLGSEAVVDRIFGPGLRSLTETLAHDVRFSLDLPDSLAMERFYGEEASTNEADIQPIHYYVGTSQVFLQDLKVRSGQVVRDDPVVMQIRWRDARTDEPEELELRTTVGALLDGAERNVHKARALMAFSDVALDQAMTGSCGESYDEYGVRASLLRDDAEIRFVSDLLLRSCKRGVDPAPRRDLGVAFKVKVDSDVPYTTLELSCPSGWRDRASLSGSDNVGRFQQVTPGDCRLFLKGGPPKEVAVQVPVTGGDLRCIVRGGRVSCG